MKRDMTDKAAILRQLWRQRLHTEPLALDGGAGRWVSIWEPGERLLAILSSLPGGLLAFWLHTGRGHIVIGSATSSYAAGCQEWRGQRYEGLCRLGSADIAADNAALWGALLACCDHLLGSRGRNDGARFSDGRGATARLQAAAERMRRAFELGYASALLATPQADASAYLIGVWLLYLRAPERLNTADPLSYRMLADSLMNEGFWRLVLSEDAQSG
jgi:hypothetical protein